MQTQGRPTPLHRHQLLRLREAGWLRLLARPWDDEARACLSHWAAHGLPLVVTRQPTGMEPGTLATGLPAPTQWGRRRLALQIARTDVLYFDEFPRLESVASQIAADVRASWLLLSRALETAGVPARIYGSHGWQWISQLAYVRRGSDIDVWLTVADSDQAESAVAALRAFDTGGRLRLDGELVFPDGRAYAWREWQNWRAGNTKRILGKAIDGPRLVDSEDLEGATS